MSDKNDTPKLSPQEGFEQVQNLIGSVVEAAAGNDLKGMDDILAALGGIVEDTGVDIPGMSDRLAELRGGTARTQTYLENLDAAAWVGDLERSQALNEAGPGLDLAALSGFDALSDDDHDEGEIDDDSPDNEDWQDDPEFAALLARFEAEAEFEAVTEILPDLYVDIAEGKPGAIDAFIASGEDPNLPRGEAGHTALLAALDAPGRRAGEIAKLIAAGADAKVVHYQGDNALSWAAGYHHPDTVTAETEIALMTLLAKHGADPNHWTAVQNWSVLHRAIIQGDGNRVAAMLAAGADASVHIPAQFMPDKLAGMSPLMVAAPKPDVVQRLLDHGLDPAEPDANGRTPLELFRKEAEAARARANAADTWTVTFAENITASVALLEARLSV